MTTGLGRVMNPLADSLSKVLPDHFPARIEVQRIDGSIPSVRLLEDGKAELVITQTDLSYLAYNEESEDSSTSQRRIRGVAVLNATMLHLIATQKSAIRSLKDLRGKRVAISSQRTAKIALEAAGIRPEQMHVIPLSDDAILSELQSGRLDAVVRAGNYPTPFVREYLQVPGVRLVPIAKPEIQTIRSNNPFLHATSIPAGTYGDHAEIQTVGVDTLLLCREDLPEELVYWITRTLFESLPRLAESLSALQQVDLEQLQASPIPLHPGAARFYRERELFQ